MAGSLALESVLEDPTCFEGAAKASFYGLQHFLADADIRAKDSDYRAMQEREMQKLIRLLLTGANGSALAKITFLGVSSE